MGFNPFNNKYDRTINIGETKAYYGFFGSPKSCRLGEVTLSDPSMATITVDPQTQRGTFTALKAGTLTLTGTYFGR